MVHLNLSETRIDSTKPPVVLTHGWMDDLTAWDGVRQALADRTTCAWDLRGHGGSEVPPPGDYGRDRALADLDSVLARFDVPVVLAGHSLGGYLSLAFTLLHPDAVAGLVLVASGPGFRNAEARQQWNTAVDDAAARVDIPHGSEEISKHIDSWVIDELSAITQPSVVVVGERDTRFQASMRVFQSKLNVVHSVVVSGAGHSVHRTHPEAVAAAIRQLDDRS